MKNIPIIWGIILLLILLSIIPIISSNETSSNIIYVDDDNTDGPWNGSLDHPYQNIQDALDISQNGDTIFVFNGTYQKNIVISTKINLQGEDSNATIIEGQYQGIVVTIQSDSVSIKGFTIVNAGFSPIQQYPGITLCNVTQCTITKNIVLTNWYGIFIDSSSFCMLSNNIIDKSYENGICIQNSNEILLEKNTFGNTSNGLIIHDCTFLEIINNSYLKKGITLRGSILEQWNTHTIQNNRKDGKNIYYFKDTNSEIIQSDTSQIILANCSNIEIQKIIFYDENTNYGYSDGCIQLGFSSHFTIHNNTILTKSNDISLYLFSCTHSIVSNNHIETKSGSAIQLDGCANNSIIENQVVNNIYGITIQNSHENIIQENVIIDNYVYGIDIQYSQDNIIKLNNLTNNFHGGIKIRSASDIAVCDNQIANDFHASLFLDRSSRISIKNNTFLEVGGVELFDSVSISIINNSFHTEGIIITGDSKENWNTHKIEQNLINGSPIEYYSNTQNISVSKHAIQVILANATNIKIQGLQTNNVRRPIQMGFSSRNLIDKNTFTLCNDCGMYLSNSDSNTISNNSLTGKESVALQSYFSMKNTIRHNSFSNNFMGILLQFSEENIIEKNNFQSNIIQAEFAYRGLRINSFQINKWDKNYWDDWIGFGPKIIIGELYPPWRAYGHIWVSFDWNPAKEPYNIPS
ncbi:NosD domain-containing protein [Thermoplasmatota archaeon]